MQSLSPLQRKAYLFIVFLGIVSLFADMTYEGARSVTGAFLAVLGANALTVGIVAGLGEFLGFGLRYVSGIITDQTHKYWPIMIVGYTVNIFAVPLLALAGSWQIAVVLIILERVGKSIRVPARDAMLAHASDSIGMGKGFGLHEMMDKIGATAGPLFVSASLFFRHDYEWAFAILAIPALFALGALLVAQKKYPHPEDLAINTFSEKAEFNKKAFTYLMIGSALLAFGFSDYPLIGYHLEKSHVIMRVFIPIAYALAMFVNAISSPILGHWYDKKGLVILVPAIFVAAFFAPLVYLGNSATAFLGVGLWAIGMVVQNSLLRSIVGKMTPWGKRGRIFGIFNLCYGAFWFIGSAISGYLYDVNLTVLVYFVMATQLLAIPFFVKMKYEI